MLWNNLYGVTIKLDEYLYDLKNEHFQGFLLNSNLYGYWDNNWMLSLEVPKDYHYDCSVYDSTSYSETCGFEMSSNTTFWDDLFDIIYNTTYQPYWTMGFNNDHYDFTNTIFQNSFVDYVFDIYYSTKYIYHLDMIRQGDKMFQNGYRNSFTVQEFMDEVDQYEKIIYGIYYVAPGISD